MENKEYTPLKDYLNHVLETYPDEGQLEDIVRIALKQDAYESNKGYMFERVNHNPREMAFYEQWQKENEPRSGVDNGNGILQDLFIETKVGDPLYKRWVLEINSRDRLIVATVIQWLGSNVGMCFLYEALKRFNAHIVEKSPTLNQ